MSRTGGSIDHRSISCDFRAESGFVPGFTGQDALTDTVLLSHPFTTCATGPNTYFLAFFRVNPGWLAGACFYYLFNLN